MEKESLILTRHEREVIRKKLSGARITQQDSNCLSKNIRPKLREIISIDAKLLLDKLEYSQKAISIEKKIKKIILKEMGKGKKNQKSPVNSIIIYGSAIQNNYKDYNDIDILIVTKSKIAENLGDKAKIIKELKKELDKHGINSDIEIYDRKTIENAYLHNPSVIYQLKDCKIIYGNLKLPDKKKEVYNIDLKMKLDWSDIEDIEPEGIDIYKALRNVILVRLILNRIVDNRKLKESLNDEIGKNLIDKLKNNKESKAERRIALNYLKELSEITRNEIKGGLWEKIECQEPSVKDWWHEFATSFVVLEHAQNSTRLSKPPIKNLWNSDIIKILGNIIGNIVVHKILVKYTNKPESVNHLIEEVGTYRDNALETAQEFNWNEKDKAKIEVRAFENFKREMEKKYSDVKFPINEAKKLVKETMDEIIIK